MNFLSEISLPNGRRTLNLGFGCVGLLRIPLPLQRTRLLRCAVELGLTHFDVARMYGLGAAEATLGRALRPFRSRVTFATKFGIPREVPNPLTVNLKYGARWIASQFPGMLKRYKKRMAAAGPSVHHVDFSLGQLELSLATSLKQMGLETLDLLFLHEPRMTDAIPADLGEVLQQKVDQGVLGAFGISGHLEDAAHFARIRPDICGQAVQYNYDIIGDAPRPALCRTFTGMFRVIDETLPQLAEALARDRILAGLWSDRLDLDLRDNENLGIVILATALALNKGGMVIFSTTRIGRLRKIIARLKANSFTVEGLLQFRDAVRSIAPRT